MAGASAEAGRTASRFALLISDGLSVLKLFVLRLAQRIKAARDGTFFGPSERSLGRAQNDQFLNWIGPFW